MRRRTWSIETPQPHEVAVRHAAYWTGKVILEVDGREVFRRERKLFDRGLEHRFEVDGRPCILRIRYLLWVYEYELFVDGRLV